jgi:hypothetical protein
MGNGLESISRGRRADFLGRFLKSLGFNGLHRVRRRFPGKTRAHRRPGVVCFGRAVAYLKCRTYLDQNNGSNQRAQGELLRDA